MQEARNREITMERKDMVTSAKHNVQTQTGQSIGWKLRRCWLLCRATGGEPIVGSSVRLSETLALW